MKDNIRKMQELKESIRKQEEELKVLVLEKKEQEKIEKMQFEQKRALENDIFQQRKQREFEENEPKRKQCFKFIYEEYGIRILQQFLLGLPRRYDDKSDNYKHFAFKYLLDVFADNTIDTIPQDYIPTYDTDILIRMDWKCLPSENDARSEQLESVEGIKELFEYNRPLPTAYFIMPKCLQKKDSSEMMESELISIIDRVNKKFERNIPITESFFCNAFVEID